MRIKRVIVIVLDSAGAGYSADAHLFGDVGANTLGNTARAVKGLKLPTLQKMGLGNLTPLMGVPPEPDPNACYGIMAEASGSKDTMAGHWEMMGLIMKKPFPVYPHGFPPDILEAFYQASGFTGVLGNKAASGTDIIGELGDEHKRTGKPIIYTSADSVFQIAAHEEIIRLDRLYEICERCRPFCDRYHIGRVIARPFTGENGVFTRTANRKDYPMYPPGPTAMDILKEHGFPVTGIGKIEDIFARRGLTRGVHTAGNDEGMARLEEELSITNEGLIFVNLVDFDMIYGHRNDARGYAAALEQFDFQLGALLRRLKDDDLLIITADHGCDPTFPGTDHTREYVPLLAFSRWLTPQCLGKRNTFADIGATILKLFGLRHDLPGAPFL